MLGFRKALKSVFRGDRVSEQGISLGRMHTDGVILVCGGQACLQRVTRELTGDGSAKGWRMLPNHCCCLFLSQLVSFLFSGSRPGWLGASMFPSCGFLSSCWTDFSFCWLYAVPRAVVWPCLGRAFCAGQAEDCAKEEGQVLAAHAVIGDACASLSQGRKSQTFLSLKLELFLAASVIWMNVGRLTWGTTRALC